MSHWNRELIQQNPVDIFFKGPQKKRSSWENVTVREVPNHNSDVRNILYVPKTLAPSNMLHHITWLYFSKVDSWSRKNYNCAVTRLSGLMIVFFWNLPLHH